MIVCGIQTTLSTSSLSLGLTEPRADELRYIQSPLLKANLGIFLSNKKQPLSLNKQISLFFTDLNLKI